MTMRALALVVLAVAAAAVLPSADAYKVTVTTGKEVIKERERTVYTGKDQNGNTVKWWFNLGRFKKYNSRAMDAYEGPSGKVTSDSLSKLGFSSSEIKAAKYSSSGESGKRCGVLNTWDNEVLSWGLIQMAGRPGTLNNFLVWFKAHYRRDFENLFSDSGVDIQKDGTVVLHGKVLDFKGEKLGPRSLRTKMWKAVRNDDVALATFLLAGSHDSMCAWQMEFWRGNFMRRAVYTKIKGHRVKDLFSSELMNVAAAYLYNWMPVYVKEWFSEFLDKSPDVKVPASGSLGKVDLDKAFKFINTKLKGIGRDTFSTSKGGVVPSPQPGTFRTGSSPTPDRNLNHRATSVHAQRDQSNPRRERYQWWLADPYLDHNEGGTLPGDELCNVAQGWCEDTRRNKAGARVNAAGEPQCSKKFVIPPKLTVPGVQHKISSARPGDVNLCGGDKDRVCCQVTITPKRELSEAVIRSSVNRRTHMYFEKYPKVAQDNTRVVIHRPIGLLDNKVVGAKTGGQKADAFMPAEKTFDPLGSQLRNPSTVTGLR